MARMTLEMPGRTDAEVKLPVRISDINYGNHMGNDAYLAMMHEARMQFFSQFGYTEMDIGGVGVIMSDTAIVYRRECYYGDMLTIGVTAMGFGEKNFDLYYRFINQRGEPVCDARTGMVCYDYAARKSVAVPVGFRNRFRNDAGGDSPEAS
jgi:acyl-CoA thioesterase FadM